MRKALIVALLVLPIAASADVLLDNLKIVDTQAYVNGNGNWEDSTNFFGAYMDLQLADDFNAGAAAQLTKLTYDFLTFGGPNPSTARVEVFEIVGGKPKETPLHQGILNITLDKQFTDTLFGLVGKRFSAVLPNWAVTPGTSYYISMQPQGRDDWGYTPRAGSMNFGGDAYLRDGGVDHGNGGQGGYGTNDFVAAGSLFPPAGDGSMRVEGIVPEPASMLLLGLAGLLIRRR
jgi:hypothetical protein